MFYILLSFYFCFCLFWFFFNLLYEYIEINNNHIAINILINNDLLLFLLLFINKNSSLLRLSVFVIIKYFINFMLLFSSFLFFVSLIVQILLILHSIYHNIHPFINIFRIFSKKAQIKTIVFKQTQP